MAAFPISTDTEPVPSHKDVWEDVRKAYSLRKVSWNHHPRGRVEIRRGKALVFANPACFEYDWFEKRLRDNFCLADAVIELKTDNSSHYRAYGRE